MKIFILSPNYKQLIVGNKLDGKLEKTGDLIVVSKIQPLESIKELFQGNEPRVLAIDPDFCDWKVPNEAIKKIPNLKAICLQTTSFSWDDIEFMKKINIPVMNLRGFSSIAVAEWATMMALNVARKIPLVVQDKWKYDYNKHKGVEIRGKTAGIIGLGSIGTAIAENCKGLGMKVQYWSKNSKDKRFDPVTLSKLMKTSDLILPAVAQNERTRGLITDKMLKSMKQNAIFVSIVHKIYNHKLLEKLIKQEKIYGLANEEEETNTAKTKGNIWTGLQLAWCTEDSMRKNAHQWVESITDASKGKYTTKVN